jgi:glycosyltransferase involved in cell wall biosynthesis
MGQVARILCFSSLYPSAARPRHGIFIENRMRSLNRSGRVALKVVSPTPWFPFASAAFGRYAALAKVPARDERYGIEVRYPRYPTIPRLGMSAAPRLMARATLGPIRRLIAEGFDFDVLDAYYFFPDGVAAAWLGRRLGKPVILTALGTDVNVLPNFPAPRRMIRRAADEADGMTTVCQALKDGLAALGVPPERIDVVLHGVDLELFRPPQDRQAARARAGFDRPTLLSVGHLVEGKGHHIAVEALARLPGTALAVIGDGEEQANLERLARELGLADRVRFLGHVDQTDLPLYYGAADALVLASAREGIPNVIMESLACGTPVLTTRVGGTPEVVSVPEAGLLLERRDPATLAEAAERLFAGYPDRAATRTHAERFSWERTTRDHLRIVDRILSAAK